MTVKSKNWTAQIDRMPGTKPNFRVYGTVTVAHPGITPKLVKSPVQDTPYLPLELILESNDGINIQVETDKFVEYKVEGDYPVSAVGIHYKGQLIQHIDEVLVTQ
jgi:hypothetical protein